MQLVTELDNGLDRSFKLICRSDVAFRKIFFFFHFLDICKFEKQIEKRDRDGDFEKRILIKSEEKKNIERQQGKSKDNNKMHCECQY